MSRYIDADLIEKELTENGFYELDKIPTADVVPVVHGKWVFSENDAIFYCTNCKNGSVRNDYPYCHWCGAVMDGEKVTE